MKSNRPVSPLFATVNVTGICNLNCKYCFFRPRLEHHMVLEEFKTVMDELLEAKVFFVNLSGGEPFTHPLIDDMLRYAHEIFQHVVVLTNGTMIRQSHLETISEIIDIKGGFPVQISLDSIESQINRKTRGGVNVILKTIRTLCELGANIVIAIVLTRFNFNTVIRTIRELSIYSKHFHIMTVQRVRALKGTDAVYGLPKETLNRFWIKIEKMKRHLGLYVETPVDESDEELGSACGAPCMAGFSHIVIDPDLQVRPCDRCVETFIGNLNHQSLHDIWTGELVKKVITSHIVFCKRDDQRMGIEAQ